MLVVLIILYRKTRTNEHTHSDTYVHQSLI